MSLGRTELDERGCDTEMSQELNSANEIPANICIMPFTICTSNHK